MSIEKERLRLLPHELIQSSDGRLAIARKDGVEFELPDEFRNFYQWIQQGLSLSQIAKGLIANRQPQKFASLSRFLGFLADAGLLADKAAVRTAESLRMDHRWPESVAFEPLLEAGVLRFPRRSVGETGAVVAAAMVCLFGAVSFYSFASSFWDSSASDPLRFASLEGWSAFAWLVAFVAVFATGRSVRAFCQVFVIQFAAGGEASLRFRLEPLALAFASDDLSKTPGRLATLIGGVGAALALAAPCLLLKWIPALQPAAPVIAFWTALLLISDLSPFVRSATTDLLRTFYNYSDRERDARAAGSGLEATMKRTHVALCVLWCACFALFLVGPWFGWVRYMRSLFDPESKAALTGAALIALSQAVILFSFFNDILSSVAYDGTDDRRLVRRLWKRKNRGLAIETAVKQGRAPALEELESLPLLRQLDSNLRRGLLKRARVVSLAEGGSACRQGGTDRSLFIVLSGRLAVARSFAGRKRKVVAFLEAGSVFGEAAFFLGQTRTADVVCLEECVLLEIAHDPQVQALDKTRSEELQLRIWFLQALMSGSFLRELPSEALDALVFAGKKKSFPAGAHIMREGEDGNACYFIVQGKASVLQNGRVINKMQNGDAFGEIALLNPGSPRTASVVADSDMIAIAIESASFWELLSSHLPLAVEIERLADRRIQGDRHRSSRAAS